MRLLPAFLFAAYAVAQDPPIAEIASGYVLGVQTSTAKYFKGIPFAGDTGGANRWLPPQPVQPWKGVLNATQFGPGCFQTHSNADVPAVLSEDCLNLNVYTPVTATNASALPVMLFWHGGGFEEGSDIGPFTMYDGSYIAGTKPVVVVTANYRLGALGFLAVGDINGNQGFLDQQFALQWVQANIRAFGGDPSRVTIWGESAGAMSVGLHMVSPGSKGLFHQAIMESNPSGFRYRSLADMKLYGEGFCQDLGCNTTSGGCDESCMRSAPLADIATAWDAVGNDVWAIVLGNWGHLFGAFLDFTPVVDGVVVPIDPYQAWATGAYNPVPMLLGSNNDEGQTFVYAMGPPLPAIAWEAALVVLFGATVAEQVVTYYTSLIPGPLDDGSPFVSQMLTDFWFRCASEQWATSALKQGVPAYFYRYDHVLADGSVFARFGLPAQCANLTCHAAELPMVFHSMVNPEVAIANVTFTPDEGVLSQRFVDYWTSFAISGNPNTGNDQPLAWPVWDPVARNALLLQTPAAAVSNASVSPCQFWDSIGYNY